MRRIVEIMRLSLILQELAAALGAAGQTGAPSVGSGWGGGCNMTGQDVVGMGALSETKQVCR